MYVTTRVKPGVVHGVVRGKRKWPQATSDVVSSGRLGARFFGLDPNKAESKATQ